ncbi:UvrD-helicase domain-containing protein [Flavobacterium collinsii]|uniref:DNA 3'-5' helicase II n=1 Tax=Flavobacterium collinsii TaxID=1114861 RepID=A0ABN7EMK2_9FLAO|nr:UvrD-helicase domain-containing protein [Flavobacterium collinsii]CAA9198763.1 ATP-dependent DNA helicase Rep [Flavobacterium collinsii]
MIAENNDIDLQIDEDIFNCLNPISLKSFFLFAGAGSGKTSTLVNVLTKFKETFGNEYKFRNRKIAIITYTNAAADEINHRLSYDTIFEVSTIHSFCWELIKNFTADIKIWIEKDAKESIIDLEDKLSRARDPNNKTAISNRKKLESKNKRLLALPTINKFVYNPNGDNYTKASLNHSEVISIACYFLVSKNLFKQVLINKYPIVLIDESQDTKKDLIEALFKIQSEYKGSFSLGLFGDTMQRIYSDGKEKLGEDLPEDWLKPAKQMNHRSKSRIIELNNNIRKEIDGQQQLARVEKSGGIVRFFIAPRGLEKMTVEKRIKESMIEFAEDEKWNDDSSIKTLTLEHHMAANRMGFGNFFNPLYQVDKLKQGLLQGNLASVNFFIKTILQLYNAHKANNRFEISNIVKRDSLIFDKRYIIDAVDKKAVLDNAKKSIDKLLKLWENGGQPTLMDILLEVRESGIFTIPSDLSISIDRTKSLGKEEENEEDEDDGKLLLAWDVALNANFDEIIRYNEYISGSSNFGTHQGVKGLEFERVLVIIDDEESKGFMFSYDKLFGIKELTKGDNENISGGIETGIDRTSRLFYVACSRAKNSLAIIAYADKPEQLMANLLELEWFSEDEIEIVN